VLAVTHSPAIVSDGSYLILADTVAMLHAAYVAFVTIGFALIAIGIAMRLHAQVRSAARARSDG
jgi:hypothetical protein